MYTYSIAKTCAITSARTSIVMYSKAAFNSPMGLSSYLDITLHENVTRMTSIRKSGCGHGRERLLQYEHLHWPLPPSVLRFCRTCCYIEALCTAAQENCHALGFKVWGQDQGDLCTGWGMLMVAVGGRRLSPAHYMTRNIFPGSTARQGTFKRWGANGSHRKPLCFCHHFLDDDDICGATELKGKLSQCET